MLDFVQWIYILRSVVPFIPIKVPFEFLTLHFHLFLYLKKKIPKKNQTYLGLNNLLFSCLPYNFSCLIKSISFWFSNASFLAFSSSSRRFSRSLSRSRSARLRSSSSRRLSRSLSRSRSFPVGSFLDADE